MPFMGFFRAKTESLLKLGAALVERFDGEVPGRLDDLVTLPGVGRKLLKGSSALMRHWMLWRVGS